MFIFCLLTLREAPSHEIKRRKYKRSDMGICVSTDTPEEADAKRRGKEIDRQMRAQAAKEDRKVKLLLLGAGESGKSTIFKQMKLIYGNKYTKDELKSFTSTVYANIMQTMAILVHHLPGDLKATLEGRLGNEVGLIRAYNVNVELDMELGTAVKLLWQSSEIQTIWSNKHEFQIVGEGMTYYMDRLDDIMKDDYTPSEADVLNSRVKTTGIVTESYTIDGTTFEMYDVGGQRNERKKWIHCFEGVTAVIFVAALSEYDMKLYEDGSTNRMLEALNLFDDICNNTFFRDSSMILFLNKKDLFVEKIKNKPISDSDAFKDFKGRPGNYEDGVNYFLKKFMAKDKSCGERSVYNHATCATDTSNVRVVFGACKDIILRGSLQEMGF
jgi:GTPase SAR1 family protein